MQPLLDREPQAIVRVFTTFLSLMGKDIQACVNLLADNAVVEFPYASDTPKRLEGKNTIYHYMKNVLAQMQDWMFINIRVYPTIDPNVLWVELHGEAVMVSTGRQYQQDYVIRLETKEDKIVYSRILESLCER
ncbi:nuclear transport factor 2 family protein [Scytonema sp. NUACC26]|uniref:nuclear transport factor 2 family protein n=1 Tax=Scytonema sp. NUACC26 TaxID=3140176 RepID=UPI0034DC5B6B